MATIRRRGARWEAQIRLKGFPSLTRTFDTRPDATLWAREKERLIERGDLPQTIRQLRDMTVGDLLDRYQESVVPLKRGADRERFKIRVIKRHSIAQIALDKVTGAVVAGFRDDRLRAVKQGTVRRELALLGHCFEVARKEWDVPLGSNPVRAVKLPPPGRPRETRLPVEGFDRFFAALNQSRTWYLRPLVLLAIETGMRRGELLALEWANVDFKSRVAHLDKTKNGDARTVPLSPAALAILFGLDVAQKGRVFAVSHFAVRQAWDRLTARAGLGGLRFHDLRHEAVSRFFELGLSIPEVALISGHRDARMLMRYTHLRPTELAEKLARVGHTTKDDGVQNRH